MVDARAHDTAVPLRAIGETLAQPVRLLGQAGPGEILVSAELGELVEGWCELEAHEAPRAGRLPEQTRVYTVIGLKPQWSRLEMHRQRPLSRFVGRARELATLQGLMDLVEGGRGQVVGIMGEPGIGKSRLCYEFSTCYPMQPWALLETQAVSYGQATPYLPIIDLLKAYFRLEDHEPAPVVRDKVTAKLLSLDATLQPILPPLLTLLGVPVEGCTLAIPRTVSTPPAYLRGCQAPTHTGEPDASPACDRG